MSYSLRPLGGAGLLTAFIAVPAHVYSQQPAVQTQEQHDHDHQAAGDAKAGGATAQQPGMMNPGMMNLDMMKMMSDMKARDAKIEALVQKMNTATGAGKTEAIADLLVALVEDRQAMRSSMMSMMNMMGPMSGHGPAGHDKSKQ
jgi:HPt (histidine-containing phosphotransfer) domain-containing protein